MVLLTAARAIHQRFVHPGFGNIPPASALRIRGSGATPFGLAGLEFLVPGSQQSDPTLSRFNDLVTYPLAP